MRRDFCDSRVERATNIYFMLSIFRQYLPLGFRFYQLVYDQQKKSGLFSQESVRPPFNRRKGRRELSSDAFLLQKLKIFHLREPAPFLNEYGKPLSENQITSEMVNKVKAEHRLHVEFFKCGTRHCWQDMNRFLVDWPSEKHEDKMRECAKQTCRIELQVKFLCDLADPRLEESRLCFIHSCLTDFIQPMRDSREMSHLLKCMKRKNSCKEYASSMKRSLADFLREATKIKIQPLIGPSPAVGPKNQNPKGMETDKRKKQDKPKK